MLGRGFHERPQFDLQSFGDAQQRFQIRASETALKQAYGRLVQARPLRHRIHREFFPKPFIPQGFED